MTPAEINQRMQPWTDVEFRRFAFRVGLFQRRGNTPTEAEALADRLALRDQDRDDRRICLECEHLQRSGHCFAASQGWIPNVSKRMEPVRDFLARCASFQWVKPS